MPPLEKGRHGTVDLLESERRAQAQLQTCRALAQAIGGAAEALLSAGSGLQKDTPCIQASVQAGGAPVAQCSRADKGGGIANKSEAYFAAESEPAVAKVCRGFLTACSSLGVELVGVASALTGDVVTPIHEMQRTFEAELERYKLKVAQAEQLEALCSGALAESRQRKEKASVELQEQLLRRDSNNKPNGKRAVKWLLKPSFGKTDEHSENNLEDAAHAQTAAVEEFAARTDQVAMARLQRDQSVEDLRKSFFQVSTRRREVLRRSLHCCASAWEQMALSFRNTAEQLRGGASELESLDAGDDLGSGCSAMSTAVDNDSHGARTLSESSAQLSYARAMEARRRVPPLPLGELARASTPSSVPCYIPGGDSGGSSSSSSSAASSADTSASERSSEPNEEDEHVDDFRDQGPRSFASAGPLRGANVQTQDAQAPHSLSLVSLKAASSQQPVKREDESTTCIREYPDSPNAAGYTGTVIGGNAPAGQDQWRTKPR